MIIGNTELKVGDTLELSIDVDDDYTVEWIFNDWTVSNHKSYYKLNVTEADAGEYNVIAMKDDDVIKETVIVTILKDEPPVEPETDELDYEVHPLEHRNSGFAWIGWWELDQVIAAKEAGEKWQDKLDELKYTRSLKAIDKWLTENPDSEIEVQESRNGYILNREFFE